MFAGFESGSGESVTAKSTGAKKAFPRESENRHHFSLLTHAMYEPSLYVCCFITHFYGEC